MKLKGTLVLFIAIISFSLSAQDWSTDVYKYGEQYPGYVIDESGKKIEGFIKYQNRYTMQNSVLFYSEKGNNKSKVKYKTADLKEYKVADKVYHCIPYSGGLSGKAIRANLFVKEGCIAEYVWYDRAENYSLLKKSPGETDEEFMARVYPPKTVYFKKGDKPRTVDYFGLKFSSKMSEWISDNKELSAKVANKEKGYKMLNILNIIEEYNGACE